MTLVGSSSGNASTRVKRVKAGPFGGPVQSAKEVSSTLYLTALRTVPGAIPIAYEADVIPVTPANFTSMTDKVTVVAGAGSNTLVSLGVWRTVSQTAATTADPYQRTFLAFKVDHQGFNSCNVEKWNENCVQFQYVKQSPTAVMITLPEPPMQSKNTGPVSMTRPGAMTAAQLLGYQQTMITPGGAVAVPPVGNIWNETRSTGCWQYIIVSPQVAASINMTQIGDQAGWQRLLNLGYKPQACTRRTYMIGCGTTGFDAAGILNIVAKNNGVTMPAIPTRNSVNTPEGVHNRRHSIQETDWVCQYCETPTSIVFPPTFASANLYVQNVLRQGFDTLPFGSAIVFQFLQYAPPTTDTLASTACPVNMPYQIEICSKTTWSKLRQGSRDLGQLSTLPLVAP